MFSRRILADPLPRPIDGEPKVQFRARFAANPAVKRAYDTPARRHAAAEQAWAAAKVHSLVSITTETTECLLFGRLDEPAT